MSKTVSAVIVCAGNSSRMGGINKIFSKVNGIPVIALTLDKCQKSKTLTDIIVVTKPENHSAIVDIAKKYGITKPLQITDGGSTRAESVLRGVGLSKSDYVSIMDGARPLVLSSDIDNTAFAAFEFGAAALGTPMTDTVKKVDKNAVIETTVDRSNLVRIQTPQIFEREKYSELAIKASSVDHEFTDDCSIYEYFGEKVKIVNSSNENIKITVQSDLETCSRLMSPLAVRVGHGYDVHKLTEDRKLVLCGVEIDFELGLLGHSDADVALHALMDSMLGAAAMGDIGRHFPDTSAEFKDISSMVLLERVAKSVFEKYTFGNCDVTIIAQKPKLLPHIPKMRENIANTLGVPVDTVNVKATTEEKLGFTGALEGISAHSVCTLYRKEL
ncbi:MAG: 2-C-methyl-D-erythritol 2,4-cyclodiphosphate synthase [Clostridia bacterium]|nr:2-C-methyl-D-erythritol 2,4-cyclodiphosphate synthase [Clostridia bacterium]